MESLKGYIRRYGIPRSLYLDQHATYKVNRPQRYKDWPFRDQEELTQFARASRQLGIRLLHAHSPQAKGRVERVFETLQDRLVKELRLAGADTSTHANKVLDRYLGPFNDRFQVPAKRTGDLHRPVDHRIDLEEILSIQTRHPLRNDRTVLHEKQWFQVLVKTRAESVMVHEYPDSRMALKAGQRVLAYNRIDGPPVRVQTPPTVRKAGRVGTHRIPPANDHWRWSFKLPGSLKNTKPN